MPEWQKYLMSLHLKKIYIHNYLPDHKVQWWNLSAGDLYHLKFTEFAKREPAPPRPTKQTTQITQDKH